MLSPVLKVTCESIYRYLRGLQTQGLVTNINIYINLVAKVPRNTSLSLADIRKNRHCKPGKYSRVLSRSTNRRLT